MSGFTISNKKEKVNFLFPADLNQKAIALADALGFTYSDFVRQAVADFVEKNEREKINREIADACIYFYETNKQIAAEWKSTETDL